MKKINLGLAIILSLAFSFVSSTVYGLGGEEALRESLPGFRGFYLVIEPLGPEIEAAGLTTAQIRMDIELRLRVSGIKLLDKFECALESGNPMLIVTPDILLIKEVPIYI